MSSAVDNFRTYTCPDCKRSWGAFPDSPHAATCYWCEARDRSPSPDGDGSNQRPEGEELMTTATKQAAPKQTAAQKAERNVVSHVTERGQAGSKRKAEQAAAKVKANADKVAAMNAADRSADEVTTRFKNGEGKAAASKKPPAKKASKRIAAKAEHANRRLIAAREAHRKGGGRGKGKKLTDGQLATWIRKELAADPTLTRGQALLISYRVDRNECSVKRFNAAFDEVQKQLRQEAKAKKAS